jgi:GNAT superfamily N-acetyltransferase
MIVIRKSSEADFPAMLAIVNDAAQAYRGVIPADRWHEPYMSADELAREIAGGVALVRHAYVAPGTQRTGVGTRLLRHVEGLVEKPFLIGTWAAASWAIEFYRRNGFTLVPGDHKDRLLRTYWSIPARQIETSVVLANGRWTEAQSRTPDGGRAPGSGHRV